jgi:hypothetical protein
MTAVLFVTACVALHTGFVGPMAGQHRQGGR